MDAHSHQPVLFLYTPPTAFLANNAPRRKRFHRKTRNGCLTCRVRRVKCDEQKPACLRCLKLNQECRYDRTIELIRDLPASVSFLPRRQDIPNLEFFIINTADMLSPGEASAITMTGPVSPHDFRSNFSRLWKSLVVPLVYTEPLIMELVSQLAGRHRLALTTSHSGIKEHSLVVRTMAKIVETRPIDIVIVGAMILFAYECLHAVATLGSGETESRGQVHSSAFMRLLPVASRDLLRSVIPIVGVTWKMMEFCAKSNARSGQPVHVPDSFEDFEAADTCFTSIVWSSNLRVALAKWLKVTHQLHERIRGDDWHQSKMILTLLIEGQFLMTAYGMSLIPSDRNMDVLLQKIA